MTALRMFGITKTFAVLAGLLSLGAIASAPAFSISARDSFETSQTTSPTEVEIEEVEIEPVDPAPTNPSGVTPTVPSSADSPAVDSVDVQLNPTTLEPESVEVEPSVDGVDGVEVDALEPEISTPATIPPVDSTGIDSVDPAPGVESPESTVAPPDAITPMTPQSAVPALGTPVAQGMEMPESETYPTESMPTGEMPVEQSPVEEMPVEEMPADETEADAVIGGNLVDTAASYGTFNTLIQAVEAAGLTETLTAGGPYTLFAPTDEAFAALPSGVLEALLLPENQDLLVRILTYHVAEGVITSDQIETGTVPTVDGGAIAVEVTDDQVIVNDGSVIAADIPATNGVIHAINRVLLPPDVQEQLSAQLDQ